MAILDFSVSGWHGFVSVTQVCFGISVSNIMCMSFVAVGRSLTIVSYVAFKMAALWFWTMFNCNPPIAHCHPLLWGGGILVDHWSTISSFICARINGRVNDGEAGDLRRHRAHYDVIEMCHWLHRSEVVKVTTGAASDNRGVLLQLASSPKSVFVRL